MLFQCYPFCYLGYLTGPILVYPLASMEELGDQSKVVFALFVMAVIYIEGLVCEGEGGRIVAPSSALPTKINT
jgi:hypothetical protein